MNNSRTILHIDDDPQFTRLVARYLEAEGYQIQSLNDPSQAMAALQEGGFRVVLLDVGMTPTDGIELLRRIKEYDGGIQVVMLTGIVTVQTALKSLRWGAEYCVFKPLTDLHPLLSALHETFRKIDLWWESLQELARRRRQEDVGAADAPETADSGFHESLPNVSGA